ncbi:MAG: hypothetical protein ABIU95_07105 [Burkholderiales bacterium]
MATNKQAAPRGIQWSAPVLIRKDANGLIASLPDRVVDALKVGLGDVLNFTQLPGGSIEVWMVKKSSYASLDDMKPAKQSTSKSATNKSTKKKAANGAKK